MSCTKSKLKLIFLMLKDTHHFVRYVTLLEELNFIESLLTFNPTSSGALVYFASLLFM